MGFDVVQADDSTHLFHGQPDFFFADTQPFLDFLALRNIDEHDKIDALPVQLHEPAFFIQPGDRAVFRAYPKLLFDILRGIRLDWKHGPKGGPIVLIQYKTSEVIRMDAFVFLPGIPEFRQQRTTHMQELPVVT